MNTPVRRSDPTRAAILAAARQRFAADGYERATIRAIAAEAGIDPAMVMRYYGSKDRLFAAAATFDLGLAELTGTAGADLVRHFLWRWESDGTFVALLRAAATNDAARERMRHIFAGQLAPTVARLCAAPEQAPVRAGLIASQMLGLALCRYVLRLPPLATLPPDQVAAWLGPTLDRYLTGEPAGG